jgi:hypothetical protein
MKITPEHYAQLRAAVAIGLPRIPSAEAYAARDPSIPRIAKAKDTAMRHRWDALWAAESMAPLSAIYEYANSDHIDTALRAIVRDLTIGGMNP